MAKNVTCTVKYFLETTKKSLENVDYWILFTPERNHEKGYSYIDAVVNCQEASDFCARKFKARIFS